MDNKIILNKNEFQKTLAKAISILAEPVKSTLGPDGLPIVLDRPGKPPLITKDGVTVANSIFLKDQKLNIVIQAIKEASLKTNEEAGDGTTTAIVLTEALIKETQRHLIDDSLTPQSLCDEIFDMVKEIVKVIDEMSIPVSEDITKIENVAFISGNGDTTVSKAVVEAIDSVGVDGVICVEKGGFETKLRVEEGFQISRGYGHLGPNGIALVNNKSEQTVEYNEPLILIYDGVIDNVSDIFDFISRINCNGQSTLPMILCAHDFDQKVLNLLMANSVMSGLMCCPVIVPSIGAKFSKSDIMDDLAVLIGAKTISPSRDAFKQIKDTNSEYIGSCSKVVCYRKKTIFYEGAGDEEKIKNRAEELRHQKSLCTNGFEEDLIKERLGRVVGGIAIIEVGGKTDLEIKERADRIEDALNATKAAIQDGIVVGGGTTILRAFEKWKQTYYNEREYSKTKDAAMNILRVVCESPIRQLAINSGKISPDIVVHKIRDNVYVYENYGYNGRTNQFSKDLLKDGVIDPTRVLKSSLMNATSIATMLLRSGGSIVVDLNKKEDNHEEPPFFMDEQ